MLRPGHASASAAGHANWGASHALAPVVMVLVVPARTRLAPLHHHHRHHRRHHHRLHRLHLKRKGSCCCCCHRPPMVPQLSGKGFCWLGSAVAVVAVVAVVVVVVVVVVVMAAMPLLLGPRS